MVFELKANETEIGPIYSAGDCPVCADSGALLLLKAIGTARVFFFCPLCGVAWREPPMPHHLDEILTPAALAPDGVELPSVDEVRQGAFKGVVQVSWNDWFPLLKAELERQAV
jgi:hypothetical protein